MWRYVLFPIYIVTVLMLYCCSQHDDGGDMFKRVRYEVVSDSIKPKILSMGADRIIDVETEGRLGYEWNGVRYTAKQTLLVAEYVDYERQGTREIVLDEKGLVSQEFINYTSVGEYFYHEKGTVEKSYLFDEEKHWTGCCGQRTENWSEVVNHILYTSTYKTSDSTTCVWQNYNLMKVYCVSHHYDDEQREWDEFKTLEFTYGRQRNPLRQWPHIILKELDAVCGMMGCLGDGPMALPLSVTINEVEVESSGRKFEYTKTYKLNYVMDKGRIFQEIIAVR